MAQSMHKKPIKGIKLNILLEEQPEGGFTIRNRN